MVELNQEIIKQQLQPEGTVVIIDTSNIIKNYQIIKNQANNSLISAVIKNDAYGLGAIKISKILQEQGCKDFFVATLSEGIILRKEFNNINIFVLHGVLPNQEAIFLRYNLIPVINTISQASLWNNFAKKNNEKLQCIVHVETGINRLALSMEEVNFLHSNNSMDYLEITCVMAHFACSDMDNHFSIDIQYNKFLEFFKFFPSAKKSLSASYGIFLKQEYLTDIVRPGVALYGGNPKPYTTNIMLPVIHFYTTILQIKLLKQDEFVGYGYRFQAKKDSRVAVIQVGYADGVLRCATNKGHVYINGYKAPMIGTVSMDLIVVDVSSIPTHLCEEGEAVELIGNNMSLDNFATMLGTVHCEILGGLTRRYPRIYI